MLQLQGKTDQKFVEASFRLFRDCFNIRTVLTPANFLEQARNPHCARTHHRTRHIACGVEQQQGPLARVQRPSARNAAAQGFAERKLMLVSEVVQCCKKIHNDETRKERLAALKAGRGAAPAVALGAAPHAQHVSGTDLGEHPRSATSAGARCAQCWRSGARQSC